MNIFRFLSHRLNILACPGCGDGDGGGINDLCESCRSKILFFGDSCCYSCGGELDGVLSCCSKCMKEDKRPFVEAVSVFSYQSFGKKIILDFKSRDMLPFARIFGHMAAERIKSACQDWDFDMVVPVPLHWSRKFSRTYNQSELFSSFMAAELGVPMVKNALRRIKRTRSQKFLSGEERHKNLRDAFRGVRNIVEKRSILLTDDVFTTGATLSCAAKALLDAGAAKVYVLSVARA